MNRIIFAFLSCLLPNAVSAADNLPQPSTAVFGADALMDFAEVAYPTLFPRAQPSVDLPPYRYRCYSATGTCLGLAGYDLYAVAPMTQGQIVQVGGLRDFVCAALPQDCASRMLWPQGTWTVAGFANTPLITTFPQAPLMPKPSARSVATGKSFFYRFGYPRSYVVADLNGDGLDDLIVAPTFFDQEPRLPLQLWINKGDGMFENRTATLIAGAAPTVGVPTSILVIDFNSDGRPDIFISDSGLETCTGSDPCPGSVNTLLLSGADGRLTDVSATNLPNNTPRFNHVVSAVADLNGDGFSDIVVPTLGGASADGSGVILWLNDGHGRFSERSDLLDDEVGYRSYSYYLSSARGAGFDRQSTGVAAIVDIDGDGQSELLTCSYSNDMAGKTDTLRVHKWNPVLGKVVQVKKIQIMPVELAAKSSDAATGGAIQLADKIGCSSISIGDVDGDGVQDLLLSWESWNQQYLQVARGLGNLSFEDVTLKWLGRYISTFYSQGYLRPILGSRLLDIDGDGRPDLLLSANGITNDMLANGNPVVMQNTGSFFAPHTLRIGGPPLAASQIAALLNGRDYSSYQPVFGRFRGPASIGLDMGLIVANEDINAVPEQESKVTVRVMPR